MVCFSLVISNQCGQTKNTISSKKKCLFGGNLFMIAAHRNWYPHLLCEIFTSITWQTWHDCHLPADCPRRSAYTARKAAARRGKSSSLRSPPRRLCWWSRPILLDRAAGHEDVDGGAGPTTVGRWTSFKARQSAEVQTSKSKTVKAGKSPRGPSPSKARAALFKTNFDHLLSGQAPLSSSCCLQKRYILSSFSLSLV